jgi:hypothetical protein
LQPSQSPAPSTIEKITVDVKGGESDVTASQIAFERVTDAEGIKKDSVIYQKENAIETVEKLKGSDEDTARIIIPDDNNLVSETEVKILTDTLNILAKEAITLEIETENAKICIPKETLQNAQQNSEKDLFFKLIPIKEKEQKEEVVERTLMEVGIRKAVDETNLSVVGTPMTIETNMPSSDTDIILPLTEIEVPLDLSEREAFLNLLAVYIEHSDGEKELVKGDIVEYKEGVYGIKFHITKFSTFTIVKTASVTNKSSECEVLEVKAPLNAVINGNEIKAAVNYETDSLTMKLAISEKASWKIYYDEACKKEINSRTIKLGIGSNEAYIKITSEDGASSKLYKLFITRKKASKKVIIVATKYDPADAYAGGVLALQLDAEVVRSGITKKDAVNLVSYIKKHYSKDNQIYIIGLDQAVNSNLDEMLEKEGYTDIKQIGGKDKYETAAKIASCLKLSNNTKVVLVNGEIMPEDAVSIQKVCAEHGYAVLFIKKDSFTDNTAKALKKINPTQIYLAGDKTQISTKAVNEMKELLTIKSDRIIRIDSSKDIK